MSPAQSLCQFFPKRFDIPLMIFSSGILLVVGLSLPLMKVEKMIFWKNEYSVITGILGLMHDQEYFLAAILFFFSVVFPAIKLITLGILWQVKFDETKRRRILEWLGVLGKWSMLDVFVVAILIVAVKLGPLANVEPKIGVYVFSLAIAAAILTTMQVEKLAKRVIE